MYGFEKIGLLTSWEKCNIHTIELDSSSTQVLMLEVRLTASLSAVLHISSLHLGTRKLIAFHFLYNFFVTDLNKRGKSMTAELRIQKSI